jgi:hypothetical protein
MGMVSENTTVTNFTTKYSSKDSGTPADLLKMANGVSASRVALKNPDWNTALTPSCAYSGAWERPNGVRWGEVG